MQRVARMKSARFAPVLLIIVAILLMAGNALAQQPPTIEVLFAVLEDGTSPFEDWSPTDAASAIPAVPTPDDIPQPGDDLNGANGYVRTNDVVIYQASFNVNEVPKDNLIITFQLSGTADVAFKKSDLQLDIRDPGLSPMNMEATPRRLLAQLPAMVAVLQTN